jgi:hypothetical protein
MKSPPRKVWVLVLGGLGIALVLMLALKWREPKYQGKTVSEWFAEFCLQVPAGVTAHRNRDATVSYTFAKTGQPAQSVGIGRGGRILFDAKGKRLEDPSADALRALGSKAVPYLTRVVQKRDLWPIVQYRQWWPKLPRAWQQIMPAPPEDPIPLRDQAALALAGMDTNARPAIPALAACLKDRSRHYYILLALRSLECPAADVLPLLREFSARQQHQDVVEIIRSLGLHDPEVSRVLGRALQDTNYSVRYEAIRLLEQSGPEAKTAVPELETVMRSADEEMRYLAARALGNIGREAAEALPLLQAATQAESDIVKNASKRAISNIVAAGVQ